MKGCKLVLLGILLCFTLNSYSQKRKSTSDIKSEGIALTLGGVSFTAAAILEGGSQYGTYKPTQNGRNTNSVLVIPPFITQTPRNIMFFAGVSLTIAGLFAIK